MRNYTVFTVSFTSTRPLICTAKWWWKSDQGWVRYSDSLEQELETSYTSNKVDVNIDDQRFVDVINMFQRRHDDHNKVNFPEIFYEFSKKNHGKFGEIYWKKIRPVRRDAPSAPAKQLVKPVPIKKPEPVSDEEVNYFFDIYIGVV